MTTTRPMRKPEVPERCGGTCCWWTVAQHTKPGVWCPLRDAVLPDLLTTWVGSRYRHAQIQTLVMERYERLLKGGNAEPE
ncbi:MAG: hypothetical protein WCG26_01945 [Chloroflexales bacterium]